MRDDVIGRAVLTGTANRSWRANRIQRTILIKYLIPDGPRTRSENLWLTVLANKGKRLIIRMGLGLGLGLWPCGNPPSGFDLFLNRRRSLGRQRVHYVRKSLSGVIFEE